MKNYNAILATSFILLLITSFHPLTSRAQVPPILVQRTIGGDSTDVLNCIRSTSDGGYIATGQALSTSGDLAGNGGIIGLWVLKLDAGLNIQWQRTYSEAYYGNYIEQTNDGGYILTGGSTIKLHSDGTIEWMLNQLGNTIHQTADNGFILSNPSSGPSLTKLYSDGTTEWQQIYNPTWGSDTDFYIFDAMPDHSGGYVIAGGQRQDVGGVNAIICKTDGAGNRTIPVVEITNHAEMQQIVKARDDNYAAFANRHDDFYIGKFDDNCTVIWNKHLYHTTMAAIAATIDSGFILAGRNSTGTILVHYDDAGNITWSGGIPEGTTHAINTIIQDDNGNFVVAGTLGYPYPFDSTTHATHGWQDAWIAIFGTNVGVQPTLISDKDVAIYPVPVKETLHVTLPAGYEQATVQLRDMLGRTVAAREGATGRARQLDLSNTPAGNYILEVISAKGVISKKVVHY